MELACSKNLSGSRRPHPGRWHRGNGSRQRNMITSPIRRGLLRPFNHGLLEGLDAQSIEAFAVRACSSLTRHARTRPMVGQNRPSPRQSAMALTQLGQRVASIDVDTRQKRLTRIENRVLADSRPPAISHMVVLTPLDEADIRDRGERSEQREFAAGSIAGASTTPHRDCYARPRRASDRGWFT